MKRFKKILIVYDLAYGGNETLEKGVDLARRNAADICILNIMEHDAVSDRNLKDREAMMVRLCGDLDCGAGEVELIVEKGGRNDTILAHAKAFGADLILVPGESKKSFAHFLGTDLTTELIRRSDRPIWVVRPDRPSRYKRIVAAVNAGKDGAASCAHNKRILEMASSLAEIEEAELEFLYAWEYSERDKERLTSDMPLHVQMDMFQLERDKNLKKLVALVSAILGDDFRGTPMVEYGQPQDAIAAHLHEREADLLVTEGSLGSPLMTALTGCTLLNVLNETTCSIMISRPAPEGLMAEDLLHAAGEIEERIGS